MIDTTTAPVTTDHVVWYRAGDADHAFPTERGYLRSVCGDVRFTVALRPVEGTVRACPGCLAALGTFATVAYEPDGLNPYPEPATDWQENELRAAWGDR